MATATTQAAIKTQSMDYQDGDIKLRGFLAYDESQTSPKPGVLVIHEWWGQTDHARQRATRLAELGYVGLALDMYGNGAVADNAPEATKLVTPFFQDRDLMRSRANAALTVLKQQPQVNPKKLAAIGFCFGGTTAIELARGGADLAGVVSFHGGLQFTNEQDHKNIKGKLLICTGAADPMIALDQVTAIAQQLSAAQVDFQINLYGQAKHGFTNPKADSHNIPGISYNAQADQRSWQAMKDFFTEIFE